MLTQCPCCEHEFDTLQHFTGDQGRWRIMVPQHRVIMRREVCQRLARHLATLPFSTRDIPAWMSERICWFAGQVVGSDGYPFEVGPSEIDLVFGDSRSLRWLASFRDGAEEPLGQRPRNRLFHRLLLIWLAVEIDIRRTGAQERAPS